MWFIQWLKSLTKSNALRIPIRNFGKVTDTIYRGALPNREGYRALSEKLGVYRVCSMIETESREDRQRALSAGIREWRHIPFSDRDAPTPDRVREWLDYVRTSDEKGAIFVHCRGGRHRTGVLVGVYRVTDQGWTKQEALKEVMKHGWYSAWGHQRLLNWILNEFDPADFAPPR